MSAARATGREARAAGGPAAPAATAVPAARAVPAALALLGAVAALLAALVAGAVPAGALPTGAPASPSASPASPSASPAQAGGPGKVLIVSLPTLRWRDVADHDLPHIDEVVARSAVASLSVRTIGPMTDVGAAYATIGAGNRAAPPVGTGGEAYERGMRLEWGEAGDVWEMRTGEQLGDASIVHVAMPQVARRADRMHYGAEPGSLGQAVRDAGLGTAVVANADRPDVVGGAAALAVVDRAGRVEGGSLSGDLLVPDPSSPYGARLDHGAVVAATRTALQRQDVVVVEASDLVRLDAYEPTMSRSAYREAFDAAVRDADALVGRLAAELDPQRDLLMLVGATAPGTLTSAQEQLTVFAMAGPGIDPGLARSGTTRRAGYVTLPDIAPTVLDHLDIDVPDAMNGTAITSNGDGSPDAGTVRGLASDNDVAVFRDRAVGPVSVVYIVLQAAVYGIAVLALLRPRHRPKLGRLALAGSLLVMAIPAVVFLSGLFPYDDLSVGGYTLVVLAVAGGLGGAAWLAASRHLMGPPIALIGLTLAVMLGDVATGGRLQINTVFGYSPVVAGRFSGFGNLSFAITAIAAIAVATGVWALPRLHGRSGIVDASVGRRGWPLWLATAILVVTLAFDGLPSIGSDVGGVLAAGPAFAVVLLMLAGARLDVRRLVAIGVGTLAVLAGFAALDLSRPPEQRTHLGRFVESAFGGGGGTIVTRKLQSNMSILTSSVWTWLVPVGLAFLIFLTWRSRGFLQHLQDRVPGTRAFMVGGLVVAVLGLAVNDSGVAIPAMMFGIALPYLTYLVIRTAGQPLPAGAEAGGGVADAGEDGGAGDAGGDHGGGDGQGQADPGDRGGVAGEEGGHGARPPAEKGGNPPDSPLGQRPVAGGTSSAGVR
jgi:hypothetical protein